MSAPVDTVPVWLRRGMGGLLALTVVLAFGLYALYTLQHPGIPTWNIGTGNDGDQYMNISVGMSQLQPFPWALWRLPTLESVVGLWNCSLVMGLFAGGFLKIWGFYPGLLYWVWTMVVLSSLFCLVPYLWQRQWGYSGVGGVVAGLLLATSPTIRQFVPHVMSDTLGMLLLGLGFLGLATLVTRERWRDVLLVSLCFAILGVTRSSLLFQLPTLLAGLALSWLAIVESARQRRERLVKLAVVAALTLLFLEAIDYSLLIKSHGRPYFWAYILSAFGWARLHGPLHQGAAVTVKSAAWLSHTHVVWLWLIPVFIAVMGWCWARRSRLYQPMALVVVPWACYMVLFLGRAGEPRHLLPWFLMETLLLSSLLDGAYRAVTTRRMPVTRWTLSVTLTLLVGSLILHGGRELLGGWPAVRQQQRIATAYLAWARARLPENALIVVSPEADPWWIARHAARPVICPTDPYHGTPLYIDPAFLHRHPFRPTKITVPHPMTRSGLAYLMNYYESRGMTLWILDAVIDPAMVWGATRPTMPGTFAYQLVGSYALREAAGRPGPPPETLYQLVATSPTAS